MEINDLTGRIIGSAIEVHRELGPGLMESSYEECLCHELTRAAVPWERQVSLPLEYKGIKLGCAYRVDLVVAGTVVVELKSVEAITRLHEAQIMTYLKMGKWPVGLIINFNVPVLREGIKRIANFPVMHQNET